MTKKKEKKSAVQETSSIPIEAVPYLYNAQMLKWQQTHFNALKAIYDKLDELVNLLEEKE